MMATVDARTGRGYEPPLADKNSLSLPLDNLSKMAVDFRLNSSLLVLRNACHDFNDRASCGVYYFKWKEDGYSLLKFIFEDPLKDFRP